MRKLVIFVVMFLLGFLACYVFLVNPDWLDSLRNAKLAVNDCDIIIEEIEKYDWDTKLATAVMKAESKCDVDAKGDMDLSYEENGRTYGYSVGAFQVRILPGREECDTFDLKKNVECAYSIYHEAGREFTDWSMFNNGKYRDYLE